MLNTRQVLYSLNNVAGWRHDCDASALPAAGTSAVLAGTTSLFALQIGAGAVGTVRAANATAGSIGVYRWATGTTPTARIGMDTSWNTHNTPADELWSVLPATNVGAYCRAKKSIQTLSTAAQEFAYIVGFIDSIAPSGGGGAQVAPNGFYWLYDRQLSLNWLSVTKNGASVVRGNSGVVVAAGAADILLDVFKLPGADVVKLSLNGVAVNQSGASIATGAPLGFVCMAFKSNGANSVTVADTDFVEYAAYFDIGRV